MSSFLESILFDSVRDRIRDDRGAAVHEDAGYEKHVNDHSSPQQRTTTHESVSRKVLESYRFFRLPRNARKRAPRSYSRSVRRRAVRARVHEKFLPLEKLRWRKYPAGERTGGKGGRNGKA